MHGDLPYTWKNWEVAMGKDLHCKKKKQSNVKDAYPLAVSQIMLWAAVFHELSCESALSQRVKRKDSLSSIRKTVVTKWPRDSMFDST